MNSTQNFSHSLPMLLYRTLDGVMPAFREIFARHGLTEPQWRVLRVLWECEALAFGALAEQTRLMPPSLVGVIDRLSAINLVLRERSENDRRVVVVKLTSEGRAMQKKVMPEVESVYRELSDLIDERKWARLLRALEEFAQAAEDANFHQSKNPNG